MGSGQLRVYIQLQRQQSTGIWTCIYYVCIMFMKLWLTSSITRTYPKILLMKHFRFVCASFGRHSRGVKVHSGGTKVQITSFHSCHYRSLFYRQSNPKP